MTIPTYLVTLLVPILVTDPESKLAWLNGWNYTTVFSEFAVYKICRVEINYSDRRALQRYIRRTITNVQTSILSIPEDVDDSIPVFLVGDY